MKHSLRRKKICSKCACALVECSQFCECKKCEAPLLHIDTYQLKNNANNFEKIPLELQELNNRISSSGHCHEHKYISLSYPNFNSNATKQDNSRL